jgi:hypothetical protein
VPRTASPALPREQSRKEHNSALHDCALVVGGEGALGARRDPEHTE